MHSEEPLFRRMVMTVLGKYLRGTKRIESFEVPSSGVAVVIVFTLAHIGYTFSPFAVTHFSLLQQFGHLF